MTNEFVHHTVLRDQAVKMLAIQPNMTVIDCTAGGGGHTEEILEALANEGKVIAFDQDRQALEHLNKKFAAQISSGKIVLVNENFDQIAHVCDRMKLPAVDAILADIGVSSPQLDQSSRGFSFSKQGPLDMRMNPDSGEPSAADIVNTYDEKELSGIIFKFGEEPKARFIAQAIIEYRKSKPIATTGELAEIVKGAVHYNTKSKKHPATKTFQALRIYVNRELEVLESLIHDGFNKLAIGGRLAIITFHSLEDRIVKKAFKKLSTNTSPAANLRGIPITEEKLIEGTNARIIKPFPQIPSTEEIDNNPRARSAKLRVIEKLKNK